MKQGLYFRIAILLVISAVFVSCGKDDDPAPFIDGYEPTLTDPKGTAYVGDYFPMEEGYTWTYSDAVLITGSVTISYLDLTESVSISTNPTYTTHTIEIGSGKTIGLNGINIFVLPAKDDSITSYFQKTDTSVNIPAYGYNDSIPPLKNPFYIKKTPAAGDKWMADPVINFDKYLETAVSTVTDFSYTASKSYIYVIGKDSVKWTKTINNKDSTKYYWTIKLEQRAQVTGKADILDDTIPGKLNFTAKVTDKINLLDTVGILKDDYFIEIEASGYYLVGGSERINISMNYNISVISILNKNGLVKNQSTASAGKSFNFFKSSSILNQNNTIKEVLQKVIQLKKNTL